MKNRNKLRRRRRLTAFELSQQLHKRREAEELREQFERFQSGSVEKKGAVSEPGTRAIDARENAVKPRGAARQAVPHIDLSSSLGSALLQQHTTPERFLHLGIDAGTSGVRVALFDEVSSRTRVFDFGPNLAGGTRFSLPAVVAIDGPCFRIGNPAVRVIPPRRFSSFKAALVHNEVEAALQHQWATLGLPYASAFTPDSGVGLGDFLYAVTLARAVEIAQPSFVGKLHGHTRLNAALGAPVGRGTATAARFKRTFATAIMLAGCVGESPDIRRLISAFFEAHALAHPLYAASAEDTCLTVRSEAQSALRALDHLRTIYSNFIVADIGASTTDTAAGRVAENDVLAYYAAGSIPMGVDDIDRDLLDVMPSRQDLLAVRLSRQEGALADRPETRQALVASLDRVSDTLAFEYKRIMYLAVRKNDDAKSWETLHVVVAGGGANVDRLRQVFEDLESKPHPHVKYIHFHRASPELPLVVGASTNPPTPDEAAQLICVLGSARPAWSDSGTLNPDEIEAVIPEYVPATTTLMRGRWV